MFFRRRAALGLMGGVLATQAASGATGHLGSHGVADDIDFTDPETRNRIYAQLRARTDGRPTFMPYRATLFGKIEGQAAVPLFRVDGFSIARATKLGPARWRLDNVEAGYYGDLVTGEPLDRWTNPLNGRECRVQHYRSFQHLDVLPDGIVPIRQGSPPAGTRFTASMGTPSLFNGQVWMHEDLIGTMPNRPKASFADPLEFVGPVLTATSLATFAASARDVQDVRRTFVPMQLSYQTMNSWRPFLRMGETPGIIAWRMFGAKAETLESVPKALRDRVLADYPDFLTRVEAAT